MAKIVWDMKAHKQGNSIKVTIPHEICNAFGITSRTRLEVWVEDNRILMEKKEGDE